MKKTRTRRSTQLAVMALSVFSMLNLSDVHAEPKSGEIVAADLLTVRKPKSEAESRLRVIRLTTRDGSMGYGDYLEFGLPAEEEGETLARLVNRYGEQGYKLNIFLTDPSMRAVGEGHTIIGRTANSVLNAKTQPLARPRTVSPRRLWPDLAGPRKVRIGHCPADCLARPYNR